MPLKAKNPSHSSALSANDLKVGREVVVFSRYTGVFEQGVIASRPYTSTSLVTKSNWTDTRPAIVVDIRSKYTGAITTYGLEQLGVIPDGQPARAWNRVGYVVDHRKRHLLPQLHSYRGGSFSVGEEEEEEEA